VFIPSSKVDKYLTKHIDDLGGYLKIFSILFYITFPNFKVLDIILEGVVYLGKISNGRSFSYLIFFLFQFNIT
jgi:hypothetical protein